MKRAEADRPFPSAHMVLLACLHKGHVRKKDSQAKTPKNFRSQLWC